LADLNDYLYVYLPIILGKIFSRWSHFYCWNLWFSKSNLYFTYK